MGRACVSRRPITCEQRKMVSFPSEPKEASILVPSFAKIRQASPQFFPNSHPRSTFESHNIVQGPHLNADSVLSLNVKEYETCIFCFCGWQKGHILIKGICVDPQKHRDLRGFVPTIGWLEVTTGGALSISRGQTDSSCQVQNGVCLLIPSSCLLGSD